MTIFKIYWTDASNNIQGKEFCNLTEALTYSEYIRKQHNRFVTIVSEIDDNVTLPGATAVVNGLLPTGEVYEWKKRRI